MTDRLRVLLFALSATLVFACADEDPYFAFGPDRVGDTDTTDTGTTGRTDAGTTDRDVGTTDTGTSDTLPSLDVGTGPDAEADTPVTQPDANPSEGPQPTLPTYSGSCAAVQSGVNTITTSGSNRTFEVFLPSDTSDMAVTFFWYGTGGSGQDYSWLQGFASGYDLAIVVPQAAGSLTFEWPVMGSDNTAAELTFVDDMVACVTETLDVDTTKIYTSGFSAGALWSSYLVMQRSNYLASAAIFSGGTGSLVRTYETPEVSIPILGFHGGDADVYGGFVNFKDQMTQFLGNLDTDGHFIVVCDHGEGHTIPNGALDGAFQFLTDHSYGDTASPHASTLPAFLPDYCRYW